MTMATILLLTTVHPRFDVRIHLKQGQTLASRLRHCVILMVADGKGDVDEKPGRMSIHDLGHLGEGRFSRMLRGPWKAFWAIRRIRPGIVHFHDPELIPLGLLLKINGYKVIYDIHEDVPTQIYGKYYIPKLIRHVVARATSVLESGGARSFDAMIAATPKIAERFPAHTTVVVQNFPMGDELVLPDPIPYAQRAPGFAYIGGITEIRGAVEMMRALKSLNAITGAHLELAGEFSPSRLEAKLRAMSGWASVHYHGQVSRKEIASLLGGVRAGLVLFHPLPNHIDAQPNKIFEYMSAGLPVIASDFPLWRQIIAATGCGMLVDPLDPEAIKDAMRWILENTAEAEAMGRRGRQAVEQHCNWDVEAEKILDLYKKLLAA